MFRQFKKILLLVGDFLFLILALVLTLLLRYPTADFQMQWQSHYPPFLIISLIWLLVFYINNLYNLNLRIRSRHFFATALQAMIASSLLSILYFYLDSRSVVTPKTNLVLFIAVYVLLFFLWRSFYHGLIRSFQAQENLIIIGLNSRSADLMKELRINPGAGFGLAQVFRSEEELADLEKVLRQKNIRAIVVTDNFGQSVTLRDALFRCLAYRITIFDYPDFYELLTDKVPVEAIGPSWFLENLREGEQNYFNFTKRQMDLVLATIILILSLPLWPVIALLIKLTSPGPVFFRQDRVGKDGEIFRILKFRSMRQEDNNQAPTALNDSRITPIGLFLRQTRLDELPQVINILRGEMSFIGPRPERPEIVSQLEKIIPFYRTRLLIKPGLTGWDQVSGKYHSASAEDTWEKLQYDLFYLKNRSLYLDLTIALRTLATIMSRGGR